MRGHRIWMSLILGLSADEAYSADSRMDADAIEESGPVDGGHFPAPKTVAS